MLAMFFNYSLKLDARTVKLEKKNGKEQHQIDQLKKDLEKLKTRKKVKSWGDKN
jgi:predicted RNase H-like nuclease (RuvC/YqgF family)